MISAETREPRGQAASDFPRAPNSRGRLLVLRYNPQDRLFADGALPQKRQVSHCVFLERGRVAELEPILVAQATNAVEAMAEFRRHRPDIT